MFKPPNTDPGGLTARAGKGLLQSQGHSLSEDPGTAEAGPGPAPGSYSMSSKPKRKGSAPTFLGASALPPSGSIQSGGGKTLLGQ